MLFKLIFTFCFVFYVFGYSNCSIEKNTIEPNINNHLVGWAGPPEDLIKKPHDYYYNKSSGKASEKALLKKDGEMIRISCIDSATMKFKSYFIGNILNGPFPVRSGSPSDDEEPKYPLIINKNPYIFQGANIKECKGISIPDPNIPFSEYKECICLLFVKVEGGKDAISSGKYINYY